MNHFVERLPWRIAALAGLLVGAASWWGGVDPWVCLLRVGGAFAVFGLMGLGLRASLQQGQTPAMTGKGKHLDETTPEMTLKDLTPPEGTPSSEREDDGKP